MDCYYDELDYDCVLINNIQGAFNATNYLIQCGHKNVGYFHSSLDISNFSERADGYYKALRANGISTSHPYVHLVSPTSDEGYRDMLRLLESKAPIADAYFADNDIIARPPCVHCVKTATASRRMSPSSALMTFRCAI